MKNFKKIIFIFLIAICFTACKEKKKNPNEVVLGTIAGPETELAEVAKQVAKNKHNIDIIIKAFNDYQEPNRALDEGVLDANMFQHEPFLRKSMSDHGYDFTILAKTFVYPMGLYSEKYKNIKDIPNESVVAIPNDPSNAARALILLENAGLISLDRDRRVNDIISLTIKDIKSNPKKLKIKEMDAAGIPRILPDVALAAINTNYAILADKLPSRDAIFLEDENSVYANIIVINSKDIDKESLKKLKESVQSKEVLEKAKKIFKDQAIKAY